MKAYIHARLTKADQAVLELLKKSTGCSESELVRKGLHRILKDLKPLQSALEAAGDSVGKFTKGPKDLARNARHLDGYGK
jgi:hypothetical protein